MLYYSMHAMRRWHMVGRRCFLFPLASTNPGRPPPCCSTVHACLFHDQSQRRIPVNRSISYYSWRALAGGEKQKRLARASWLLIKLSSQCVMRYICTTMLARFRSTCLNVHALCGLFGQALLALDGTACGWTKIFRNRNLSCDDEKMHQGSESLAGCCKPDHARMHACKWCVMCSFFNGLRTRRA
jgi:hypothetical protein